MTFESYSHVNSLQRGEKKEGQMPSWEEGKSFRKEGHLILILKEEVEFTRRKPLPWGGKSRYSSGQLERKSRNWAGGMLMPAETMPI